MPKYPPKLSPEQIVTSCSCGNTEDFVGYGRDHRGNELTQPYVRYEDGDVTYDTHDGNDGAEIGEYHCVECEKCGNVLYGKRVE